jgi:acyl-homoserine lactone acylase PvdQ
LKKGVVGFVLAIALTAILLASLPLLYAPSSLMSLSDPVTGVWGSVYMARNPAQGRVVLPGLESSVVVVVDGYGMPHIFAKSELDFAYALGYLHAHDKAVADGPAEEARRRQALGGLGRGGLRDRPLLQDHWPV